MDPRAQGFDLLDRARFYRLFRIANFRGNETESSPLDQDSLLLNDICESYGGVAWRAFGFRVDRYLEVDVVARLVNCIVAVN